LGVHYLSKCNSDRCTWAWFCTCQSVERYETLSDILKSPDLEALWVHKDTKASDILKSGDPPGHSEFLFWGKHMDKMHCTKKIEKKLSGVKGVFPPLNTNQSQHLNSMMVSFMGNNPIAVCLHQGFLGTSGQLKWHCVCGFANYCTLHLHLHTLFNMWTGSYQVVFFLFNFLMEPGWQASRARFPLNWPHYFKELLIL